MNTTTPTPHFSRNPIFAHTLDLKPLYTSSHFYIRHFLFLYTLKGDLYSQFVAVIIYNVYGIISLETFPSKLLRVLLFLPCHLFHK